MSLCREGPFKREDLKTATTGEDLSIHCNLHSVGERVFKTAASFVLSVRQNVYLHRVLYKAGYLITVGFQQETAQTTLHTLAIQLGSKSVHTILVLQINKTEFITITF